MIKNTYCRLKQCQLIASPQLRHCTGRDRKGCQCPCHTKKK